MTLARYAVYFAPDPGSDLWEFGSRWLGRDAAAGCNVGRPDDRVIGGLHLDAITATPAHYGFHATLKPPFHLAEDQTPDDLLAFAAEFASQHTPVTLPTLQVSLLGNFVALTPTGNLSQINALAAACIHDFDVFRAPLAAGDFERRKKATLTPRQIELLHRWGYPYVMEEFRLHLTLTGPLNTSQQAQVLPVLKDYFSSIVSRPCAVDAISIFAQQSENGSFELIKRYSLTGG